MMKFAVMLVLASLLAACGEYKGSVPYQDGQFAGKKDERSWDGDKFGHNKGVWVEMIHARNMKQNEYRRTDYQEQ